MKLSQLIAHRKTLEDLTPTKSGEYAFQNLLPFVDTVGTNQFQMVQEHQALLKNYHAVLESFKEFDASVDDTKRSLQTAIEALEPQYFANSYRLYESELRGEWAKDVLPRTFLLSDETSEFLSSRIKMHSNWQYSGMIIRPANESWIKDMVACDPLYVVDVNPDLLEPVKEHFNERYLNRLRWCVIKETIRQPILSGIPDEQIGFGLIYNFFHYKPLELIKFYLEELYTKIRPGGVLAFTFNDCDRTGGVALAERGFMCYTPGRLIVALCEKIGFEIKHQYIIDDATTWIEIKKPGEITTLRGGQALAMVIDKHQPASIVDQPVDNVPEKTYTKEEINAIQQEAIDLRVDTPEMIRTVYSPQKLQKLIKKRKKQQ